MPPHKAYLEPYFGSGAVFFSKEPAQHETINDLDGMVVNFFRVCRDQPDQLAEALYFTPYAREEYMSVLEECRGAAISLTDDPVENARRFAVRCNQSFGARLDGRSGWSVKYITRGRNPEKSWAKTPELVYRTANRLRHAQIEQTDAVDIIRRCNNADCLIYADPPYLGSTRSGDMYRCEMTGDAEHLRLLEALVDHRGPVLLSGYDNDLYNETLTGWSKATMRGHANTAETRMETVWMNYERQMSLDMPVHPARAGWADDDGGDGG